MWWFCAVAASDKSLYVSGGLYDRLLGTRRVLTRAKQGALWAGDEHGIMMKGPMEKFGPCCSDEGSLCECVCSLASRPIKCLHVSLR